MRNPSKYSLLNGTALTKIVKDANLYKMYSVTCLCRGRHSTFKLSESSPPLTFRDTAKRQSIVDRNCDKTSIKAYISDIQSCQYTQ